jgi:hypothetical protein
MSWQPPLKPQSSEGDVEPSAFLGLHLKSRWLGLPRLNPGTSGLATNSQIDGRLSWPTWHRSFTIIVGQNYPRHANHYGGVFPYRPPCKPQGLMHSRNACHQMTLGTGMLGTISQITKLLKSSNSNRILQIPSPPPCFLLFPLGKKPHKLPENLTNSGIKISMSL